MGRREGWQITSPQTHGQDGGRQLQVLEAATGQFEQHGGLAFGTEQADRHLAVGQGAMFQVQTETLDAAVPPGEKGGQVGGQSAQWKQQGLVGLHLEIQFDAGVEDIRRAVELQR